MPHRHSSADASAEHGRAVMPRRHSSADASAARYMLEVQVVCHLDMEREMVGDRRLARERDEWGKAKGGRWKLVRTENKSKVRVQNKTM